MKTFEERLWADLAAENGPALALAPDPTAGRRRLGRPIAAAATIAAIAAAGIIGPSMFGGSPPAYAVVQNPDGSITITVNEVKATEKATADLRALGVRAVALPTSTESNCDAPSQEPDMRPPVLTLMPDVVKQISADTTQIRPDLIQPDYTLLLAYSENGIRIVPGENPTMEKFHEPHLKWGFARNDRLPRCFWDPQIP